MIARVDGQTPGPQVRFQQMTVGGYDTGVLDITLADRRILSVPSQLGCRVGCTFCVSHRQPLVRNLRAEEILALIRMCLEGTPPDSRPIEVSFTGEGEPLLNWRETEAVCIALPRLSPAITRVRYAVSGLGVPRLLDRLSAADYPMRLQFSLHAARDVVRSQLVPRSAPLDQVSDAIGRNAHRFMGVEANVVLQDGVNDSEDDLIALIDWGQRDWPILLNPLLVDGAERVGRRTTEFEQALRSAGRIVRRYESIGALISRGGLYPLLSARPEQKEQSGL